MMKYCCLIIAFIAAISADHCGEEIVEYRECGMELFEDWHPGFYERRMELIGNMSHCFEINECEMGKYLFKKNLDKLGGGVTISPMSYWGPWSWFINWYFMPKPGFQQCIREEVIKKIIYPSIEHCMEEKFKMEGYEMPNMMKYFKPKGKGPKGPKGPRCPKSRRELRYKREYEEDYYFKGPDNDDFLTLIDDKKSKLMKFDLADKKIREKIVEIVSEGCHEGNREGAMMCIKEVGNEFWESANMTCQSPIVMAAKARENFKDFCEEKKECKKHLDRSCRIDLEDEPILIKMCSKHIPLDAELRRESMEAVIECLHLPEDEPKDLEAYSVMYELNIMILETVTQELCNLEHKDDECEKVKDCPEEPPHYDEEEEDDDEEDHHEDEDPDVVDPITNSTDTNQTDPNAPDPSLVEEIKARFDSIFAPSP